MPKTAWTGYGRFCPLARALDVVGERWTLVIVQELMKRPSRYSDLARRLPGISTSVLADRLRTLEAAGVIQRVPGPVGEGVGYAVTQRGLALGDALEALRRWGVTYLTDPDADGAGCRSFDVRYVDGIDSLDDGEFGLVVDDNPTTLRFAGGHLEQRAGAPQHPELVVRTSAAFMDRWAGGEVSWDDGIASGQVTLDGPASSWPRWLAATGYLLRYPADSPTDGLPLNRHLPPAQRRRRNEDGVR
jgi:DNA-binding HxlR family transcriptional regulator